MTKLFVSLLVALLALSSAHAELFKWKDAEGNIIYSDQPPPGANKKEAEVEEKELPQIVTVPAPDLTKSSNITRKSKSKPQDKYTSIAIANPKHDSEVRENAGNVSISVRVEPYIFNERGDMVAIYMDGVEISKGPQTSVQLQNVDRGTHTLKAEILNSAGQVLKSTETTVFHLKRFSVN